MSSDEVLLVLSGLLWLSSFLWLSGTTLLARLQPLKRRTARPPCELPPISIVMPTSAAQDERAAAEREMAVASLLALEYPTYEIIGFRLRLRHSIFRRQRGAVRPRPDE